MDKSPSRIWLGREQTSQVSPAACTHILLPHPNQSLPAPPAGPHRPSRSDCQFNEEILGRVTADVQPPPCTSPLQFQNRSFLPAPPPRFFFGCKLPNSLRVFLPRRTRFFPLRPSTPPALHQARPHGLRPTADSAFPRNLGPLFPSMPRGPGVRGPGRPKPRPHGPAAAAGGGAGHSGSRSSARREGGYAPAGGGTRYPRIPRAAARARSHL